MTNESVIDAKVKELKMLEAHLKDLEASISGVKAELKAMLDSENVDCIETSLSKVYYLPYSKRVADTNKLKADNIYDRYSKEQTVLTLKVFTK